MDPFTAYVFLITMVLAAVILEPKKLQEVVRAILKLLGKE